MNGLQQSQSRTTGPTMKNFTSIDIEIPFLTQRPNQKKGAHWSTANKERDQIVTFLKLKYRHLIPVSPYRRAKLHYFRYSSSCPDFDGMVDSMKRLQDALVMVGFLEDDSMRHVGKPQYDWIPVKAKQGKVQVVIYPLPDVTVMI